MFGVMLSHTDLERVTSYMIYFRPFFLVLFFLVSGMLYKPKSIKEDFLRVLRCLIFPLFFFTVLNIVLDTGFLKALTNGGMWNYVKVPLGKFLLGDTYWFLSCLAVVQILYSLIYHLFGLENRKDALLYIGIVALLSIFFLERESGGRLPWNADTAIYAAGYFMLGAYLTHKGIKSWEIPSSMKWWALGLFALYIGLVYYLDFKSFGLFKDMHHNRYGAPLLALAVSVFSCAVMMLLAMNFNLGSYTRLLGQYSLVVYCCQGYCFFIVRKLFSLLHLQGLETHPDIYFFVFCFISGCLAIAAGYLFDRFLPEAVGKKRIKHHD